MSRAHHPRRAAALLLACAGALASGCADPGPTGVVVILVDQLR